MSDAQMPAAGWYPDPENPRQLRWWDGASWTDHRVTKSEDSAPEGLRDVGAFISATFGAVTGAWRPLAALCAVAVVPLVVALLLADAQLGVSEWLAEVTDAAATTAPGDQLVLPDWDGDPATVAIWGVAVAGLYGFAVLVLPLAAIPLLDRSVKDETLDLDAALRTGLKAAPRALGVGLVMAVASLVLLAVAVLLVVAIPLLALLIVPAGIALSVLFYVRVIVLLQPLLVLEKRGLSVFRRSWELSAGHGWGLLGRSLLFSLIVSAATYITSFPTSIVAAVDPGLVGFSYAISIAVGSVAGVLGAAAPVVLYRDLVDGPPVKAAPTVWGPPPAS